MKATFLQGHQRAVRTVHPQPRAPWATRPSQGLLRSQPLARHAGLWWRTL